MAHTYSVPAATAEASIEIKKSRFIARAAHTASRKEVMAFVEQAHQDHPEARHVCWAYLLGNPSSASNAGMNDAGEPSGTAGKPILNVIQHKGIGDIVVVVIRYFGGIKLGAGGLMRAYSGAAEAAVSQLPLKGLTPKTVVTVELDFSQEQPLRHWASTHGGNVEAVNYGNQVTARLNIEDSLLGEFEKFCLANSIRIPD
ncbi:YigZ family protein [Solemya velesiana gill symbiont]|uniref:YigZ family protein n=1 Tax=Solemya velesiana gill symbiont TaxID=1918948 RepID=A0A1T2KYV7_9GAMM|nr:YigZ family protein [Solemya velesiana gill symbiont]